LAACHLSADLLARFFGKGEVLPERDMYMTEKVGTTADLDLIQRIIPHRYPFLLIDKVRDIFPFESCVGIKCITINEALFHGHFPGLPVFPGVLVIEAMAQTSGVLVGMSVDLVDKNAKVFFMSVENAKFRRKVVPGDVLELNVRALRGGGRVWKFEGLAKVDGVLACEAIFTAMIDLPKA